MVNAVGNGKTNGETNKPKMQEILAQIARYGPHDVTVLITGETGTGKELVAKAVHQHSGRRHADFVPRNCAAIPEALIESELFGHVKGAFTSASSDRLGAFEQAHGGSIFLDEIGELKLDLQARLLRVLQEKKVQRVGSNKLIDVDVRVIAATNSDLQKLMEEGRFRADLYFRLDVARIHLPPLRERKEDIPHLAHYFLADFNERNNRHKHFTEEALMAMICHDWPGNVRELQNIVERSCIETIDDAIWLGDLPPDIQQIYRAATKGMPLWETVEAATRTEMSNLLHFCQELLRHGNVQQAVQSGQLQIFGIPRENCYEYIKTFIDGNASSFPQDIKEKLAKQAIVLMQDQLMAWCKDEKLGRMEELVRDIEKLLGRTRRMVDNWKREVGFPPFYS
jgi:transcriptional regulator with PAS, ATPase and Fis domain